MSGIFISYRRGDGAASAGRLYDRLERDFPRDQLFLDVDAIPPGADFVDLLQNKVDACGVLLAVIGRGWLDARDEDGARRLDNPDDFVRIELVRGLSASKRVIPVLVDGAVMPRSERLPEDLRPLARRNAVRLSHESFKADSDRLVRSLKEALTQVEAANLGREGSDGDAERLARQAMEAAAASAIGQARIAVREPTATPRPDKAVLRPIRQHDSETPSQSRLDMRAVEAASGAAPSPSLFPARRIASAIGLVVAIVFGIWLGTETLTGWLGADSKSGTASTADRDVNAPEQSRSSVTVELTKEVQIPLPKSKAVEPRPQRKEKAAKAPDQGTISTATEQEPATTGESDVERLSLPPPDANPQSGDVEPVDFDARSINDFLTTMKP